MQRDLALLVGVVLAALAAVSANWAGLGSDAAATAGITALCATWWVLEPIPIPATSLIPFGAFPLLGVLSHRDIGKAYGHTMILLLLGGFMLSAAVEKSGAHRRIALGLVKIAGGTQKRLVLGFMLASALCSMWISNTATTLMLLPVAVAAIAGQKDKALTVPLLLGIAYAASIGGLATPVGTPPNVIFMGQYQKVTGSELSFLSWMSIGVPVVAIMLPIAWLWLTRRLPSNAPVKRASSNLGPVSRGEARVLAVFAITALAWVFRTAPFGGWAGQLGLDTAGDSTVALCAVVVLFLIPDGDGGQLLDWPTAIKIPWGLLILFGGGIAIADGFATSGLSVAIGELLSELSSLPSILMIAVIAVVVTFLTEVTSNTATTTLLMPILGAAAIGAGLDPKQLMIPAALSASCAFMLPVATAPNAIMFGTGRITTRQMIREGFALNLIGAIVITVLCTILLKSL